MSGRFVWLTEDERDMYLSLSRYLREQDWPISADRIESEIVDRWDAAAADPVGVCLAAARRYDRPILGDAEAATETVALMLRALGRPYPTADWRDA